MHTLSDISKEILQSYGIFAGDKIHILCRIDTNAAKRISTRKKKDLFIVYKREIPGKEEGNNIKVDITWPPQLLKDHNVLANLT